MGGRRGAGSTWALGHEEGKIGVGVGNGDVKLASYEIRDELPKRKLNLKDKKRRDKMQRNREGQIKKKQKRHRSSEERRKLGCNPSLVAFFSSFLFLEFVQFFLFLIQNTQVSLSLPLIIHSDKLSQVFFFLFSLCDLLPHLLFSLFSCLFLVLFFGKNWLPSCFFFFLCQSVKKEEVGESVRGPFLPGMENSKCFLLCEKMRQQNNRFFF